MGGQILDGKIKDFLVVKASLEILINITQIDLLFNLQLVVVGEVERHRHVGLPHAALHVEHGQGVGGAFVEGEFFGLIVLIKNFALLGECDWAAVEVYGFVVCGCCVSRTACFVGADIGGYDVVCSITPKFQQAGRFTVRAADIQHQLTVNVDPHIIVTGEEELDGDFDVFTVFIRANNNLTVIRQCKVKLQLRTKAVVVFVYIAILLHYLLIKWEETISTGLVIIFIIFCAVIRTTVL